jgi:hypothetical protein
LYFLAPIIQQACTDKNYERDSKVAAKIKISGQITRQYNLFFHIIPQTQNMLVPLLYTTSQNQMCITASAAVTETVVSHTEHLQCREYGCHQSVLSVD